MFKNAFWSKNKISSIIIMVEFSQDIWDEVKSFRTITNIILNSKSFIIKDVVLKYIKTEIEYNTTRIDWFSIEDDII